MLEEKKVYETGWGYLPFVGSTSMLLEGESSA